MQVVCVRLFDCAQTVPTLGLVIDRFMKEERINDILKQKPGVTTITDGIS